MELVQSIEQLRQQSNEIRSLRCGFITNFFLDPEKHGVWIGKGDCMLERIGNTLFIIKKSPAFWNVFFCSTSLDELGNAIDSLKFEYLDTTMIVDIVGRDVQCEPMVELLRGKGFKEATSLVRMSRMANPFDYFADKTISKATVYDMVQINQLLHEHFDEQTEQIPYYEELCEYANQGHVLVCIELEQVVGFLIYELNATTLFLRYWFTDPDYRDRKVGSRLLRRFFEEGRDTKRQLLWVIRSNENAIKRYRHYGFTEENMFDFIMRFN